MAVIRSNATKNPIRWDYFRVLYSRESQPLTEPKVSPEPYWLVPAYFVDWASRSRRQSRRESMFLSDLLGSHGSEPMPTEPMCRTQGSYKSTRFLQMLSKGSTSLCCITWSSANTTTNHNLTRNRCSRCSQSNYESRSIWRYHMTI